MAAYATYTKFYSADHAQFLITLLQQHNIPYKFEHEVGQLDKVYVGESIDPMFELQVPSDRFNQVNALQAEQAKVDMAQPGFEHVMQSYTVEELREIINDPTWNAYDLQVAATLLSEKTQEMVVPSLENDVEQFVPHKLDTIWIVLCYISALLGASYLSWLSIGAFFGGLVLTQATKTLKDGTRVKMYDENSRMHGRYILVLSVICVIISFVILYLKLSGN